MSGCLMAAGVIACFVAVWVFLVNPILGAVVLIIALVAFVSRGGLKRLDRLNIQRQDSRPPPTAFEYGPPDKDGWEEVYRRPRRRRRPPNRKP